MQDKQNKYGNEGLKEGIKEGLKDKAIEVAREMLSDGEAIEKISKWTKLPIAAVKELQEQIMAQ